MGKKLWGSRGLDIEGQTAGRWRGAGAGRQGVRARGCSQKWWTPSGNKVMCTHAHAHTHVRTHTQAFKRHMDTPGRVVGAASVGRSGSYLQIRAVE